MFIWNFSNLENSHLNMRYLLFVHLAIYCLFGEHIFMTSQMVAGVDYFQSENKLLDEQVNAIPRHMRRILFENTNERQNLGHDSGKRTSSSALSSPFSYYRRLKAKTIEPLKNMHFVMSRIRLGNL
jgi:hypothetical protein